MPANASQPSTSPASSETVRLRTFRTRRWRVWRSLLVFSVATVALLLLAIQNRDEAAIRAEQKRMQDIRNTLQQAYDQDEPLPPLERNDKWIGRMRYHRVSYNIWFSRYKDYGGEVGVGYSRAPLTRLLGGSGRFLITFVPQAEQFKLSWISEADFQQVASQLGFQRPSGL
jgi:hypothetical protein